MCQLQHGVTATFQQSRGQVRASSLSGDTVRPVPRNRTGACAAGTAELAQTGALTIRFSWSKSLCPESFVTYTQTRMQTWAQSLQSCV